MCGSPLKVVRNFFFRLCMYILALGHSRFILILLNLSFRPIFFSNAVVGNRSPQASNHHVRETFEEEMSRT